MDLLVNGQPHRVSVEPDVALLYVLRDHLDLTGAKYGCGEGQCGACTVLVDGTATRSCITPVSAVGGKQVLTIEGLAHAARLHPVQESFIKCDAMQCGYCTPGMILSSVALLRKAPSPTDAEIKQALEGNICRCGTYNRIVSAVRQASQSIKTASREGAHV
jgi:aerobic-type carbon monoxide dehydrogenase small subunit (CoxS/CutS family)